MVSTSKKEKLISAVIARNECENPRQPYRDNYERGLYVSTSTSDATNQYEPRARANKTRAFQTPRHNTAGNSK